MTDHSETHHSTQENTDLFAANAALLAENKRMAELLAAIQNNGDRKEHSKKASPEQNEEHQSESNAKTAETLPRNGRRRANPFSEEIMNYKMPLNFTLPMTLTSYKRIGDPKVHVTKFESMMFLNSDCDPILCRSFPTFLDGAALLWFSNLPAGSITSFDEFAKMFNTRREDIIKDILHNRLIKPPVKAGTYQDQRYVDKGKHCAFHQKFGYTTDECVAAKDLLERLAQQGLLDKYMSSRNQKEADTSKPKHNSDHSDKGSWRDPFKTLIAKGVINYISGGFAGGGITSTARKRSYRAMMTMEGTRQNSPKPTSSATINFGASDFKLRAPNLDDPVVISVSMGPLTVKKVLLDPGSSVDILFYSTFKKMQLSDNSLQPSGGELAGFSGERVPISGYIWMRTTLGEPPNSKSLDI
ncbi:uncharacterized protein [Arachis hypogaea]|uniref:uncharacterized protein n=1 Tax=Arachis hypogaea TaxID=3818 RepID=UPI003B21783E